MDQVGVGSAPQRQTVSFARPDEDSSFLELAGVANYPGQRMRTLPREVRSSLFVACHTTTRYSESCRKNVDTDVLNFIGPPPRSGATNALSPNSPKP